MITDRKYLWSWIDIGEEETSGISSLQMIAVEEFGETGQYTEEECQLLCRLLREIPCPVWKKYAWKEDGHSTLEDNREAAREFNRLLMEKFEQQRSPVQDKQEEDV